MFSRDNPSYIEMLRTDVGSEWYCTESERERQERMKGGMSNAHLHGTLKNCHHTSVGALLYVHVLHLSATEHCSAVSWKNDFNIILVRSPERQRGTI